jgi:hypothetical protein
MKTIENCENCPASSPWAWYGPGVYCFGWAYFYGKARKPELCLEMNRKRALLKKRLDSYSVKTENREITGRFANQIRAPSTL